MYNYEATVLKIVDGDTVDVTIDLGFGIHTSQRIRLAGIDAPERFTNEGKAAKQWLIQTLVKYNMEIVVTVEKKTGKYGRWIGWIRCERSIINDDMVKAGHAVPYLKSV